LISRVKPELRGQSDWNAGTVMADVNGDGYLDIYVCAWESMVLKVIMNLSTTRIILLRKVLPNMG
jgi:hypothetical protein